MPGQQLRVQNRDVVVVLQQDILLGEGLRPAFQHHLVSVLVHVTIFTANETSDPPGNILLNTEQIVVFRVEFHAVCPKLRVVRDVDQSEVDFYLAPECGDLSVN